VAKIIVRKTKCAPTQLYHSTYTVISHTLVRPVINWMHSQACCTMYRVTVSLIQTWLHSLQY